MPELGFGSVACARGFLCAAGRRTTSTHPSEDESASKKARRGPLDGSAGWVWVSRSGARARVFVCGRTERPGHVVVLAQNASGHVGGAGGDGGELECPSGVFVEGDAAGGDFIDGAGDLIDRGGEVSVMHADDGLACSLDPVEDLLVLDLEFGISLGLFAYDLPWLWYLPMSAHTHDAAQISVNLAVA